MLEFAKRPIDDRLAYFNEIASRRGQTKLIVEKDFWVCFTLRLLFEMPDFADAFIFKGGTSLSKVFGIIERFSEDIDLSVNPVWLGFGDKNSPDKAPSQRKFLKKCKDLEETCIETVKDKIQPILENTFTDILGPKDSNTKYLVFKLDQRTGSPVLFFQYPTYESDAHGYIYPQVKMEFGSLTDQEPIETHKVKSWVAEEFPEEFEQPYFRVISLSPERTFWEKATILHVEYHRPPEKPLRKHLSRDFYDVFRMAQHESGKKALADLKLLRRVVNYKKRYFHSGWAHYEEAIQGPFRLVPPKHRLAEIKNDYQQMEEMFYGARPDFNELLAELKNIENKINSNLKKNEVL